MSKFITVVPMHGRDYTSQKAVRQAWRADLDFRICDIHDPYDGKPMNRQGADEAGLTVNVRYARLTKICVIKPGSVRSPLDPIVDKATERALRLKG